MFDFYQKTVSATSNNGDWFEHVETQSHVKPAVVPETINLNR